MICLRIHAHQILAKTVVLVIRSLMEGICVVAQVALRERIAKRSANVNVQFCSKRI